MGWVTEWRLKDRATAAAQASARAMSKAIQGTARTSKQASTQITKHRRDESRATQQTTKSVSQLSETFRRYATVAGVGLAGRATLSFAKTADQARVSMLGLNKVATNATGQVTDMTKAVNRAISDGFLPMTAAATGLRNLMLAGLGANEASIMLERFKDIAALGKSESISFEQAIVNLTQAFKTEQSELGDLSGLTENFSKLLPRGVELQRQLTGQTLDLANAQERAQAKFLAISEVWKDYEGGLEELQGGTIEATAKMSKAWFDLKVAVGDEVGPSVVGTINAIAAALRGYSEAVAQLPDQPRIGFGRGVSLADYMNRVAPRGRAPLPPAGTPQPFIGPSMGAGAFQGPAIAPPSGTFVGPGLGPQFPIGQGPQNAPGGFRAFEINPTRMAQYLSIEPLKEMDRVAEDVFTTMDQIGAVAVDGISRGIADIVVNLGEMKNVGDAINSIFKSILSSVIQIGVRSALSSAFGLPGIGFAEGGMVPNRPPKRPIYAAAGYGPRGTDTVPAWLTPGEGVLTRAAVRALGGGDAIRAINANPGGMGGPTVNVTVGTVAGAGGVRNLAAELHAHLYELIRDNDYRNLARN